MTNEQSGFLLVLSSLGNLTAVGWPPVMDLLSRADHSDFWGCRSGGQGVDLDTLTPLRLLESWVPFPWGYEDYFSLPWEVTSTSCLMSFS